MIYISLAFVVMVHFTVFRKRGLLDPVSVFFIAYLYYSYFTPVTMSIFGQFDFDILNRTDWVSDDTLNRSAILSAVGYVGYAVGYFFLSKKENFGGYPVQDQSFAFLIKDNYARIIMLSIILIALIIVIFFYRNLLSSTESYDGKIAGNYAGSTYAFLLAISLTLLSLLTNYMILNVRNYFTITTLGVLMFFMISILTFSKGPFIYAALCTFCFLHRYRRIPSWMSLTSIATLAVLALVYVIPAFAAYRYTGVFTFDLTDPVTLNNIYSDAAGPFGIINFALNGYVDTDAHPLWQSFILWIPRGLWPDRPFDVAEAFARQIIVGWQPGYGLGFSPLAEGYARFGLWGSGLFMAIVGATTAILQSFFGRFVPAAMRVPTLLTIGGYVSVLVLRGAFSGLLTQSIQTWVPIVAVSLVAREIARRLDHSSGSVTTAHM